MDKLYGGNWRRLYDMLQLNRIKISMCLDGASEFFPATGENIDEESDPVG